MHFPFYSKTIHKSNKGPLSILVEKIGEYQHHVKSLQSLEILNYMAKQYDYLIEQGINII